MMEQPKQWLTETEQYEEELAYMYQEEELLPDHQGQYYTSFYPSRSSCFPSFGGESLNELGPPSPAPSPSANFLSFGAVQASTLNFSGGAWQHDGLQVQGMKQQLQAAKRRGRAMAASAQEHVIAERKRREKLQQQFVSLATIVPGITKADKISLLGSTIDYVKQLEEKVKALGQQGPRKSPECTVFESKCSISAADKDNSAGPSGSGSGSGDVEYSSPVDIEASTRGNTVLLKICCKDRRGVLVMVLSKLENQGLSIITTNVLPFMDSCLDITITAKIEEGFSSAVELVNNLKMALDQKLLLELGRITGSDLYK